MCFSYVFLAAGPYYELSQEEAAKAAAEAKASKASEESGDRWVAKPQWKTVETQGKPPWKSPLFPTSSGKISKNILRNCGKSNVISVFFPVTLTTIFSFILFVGSATGLGWFIHVTRIFWCGFFNMLKPPNPSIGWCSGCPRSRKFRIIHHFWYYTNQNFTNYMNASLDPVGKLHLFWTCYHWCK